MIKVVGKVFSFQRMRNGIERIGVCQWTLWGLSDWFTALHV